MTLFRKYYKDANNDIKADEAFINSVIENTHKPRAKRTPYYRYALTAAAAFVIMSVTAIALPILTDNNDDGVITVVTETMQPSAPVDTPKTDTVIKSAASKQQATPIVPAQAVPTVIPTEQPEEKRMTFSYIAENMLMEDRVNDSADLGADKVTVSGAADVREEIGADSADEAPKKSSGGRGGGSIAPAPALASVNTTSGAAGAMPVVSPPTGYYASETGNGMYVFVSEGGAEITVTYNYTDAPDTSPVYGEESVSFVSRGVEFNITYNGAEKSAVDELINALR